MNYLKSWSLTGIVFRGAVAENIHGAVTSDEKNPWIKSLNIAKSIAPVLTMGGIPGGKTGDATQADVVAAAKGTAPVKMAEQIKKGLDAAKEYRSQLRSQSKGTGAKEGRILNENIIKKTSPIEIPSKAVVKKQLKSEYDQVKYNWTEGEYKYEARWHTRTSNAPKKQGNTWVIIRTRPGTATGLPKVQHILTKEGWVTINEWQTAIQASKNGTATQSQKALLNSGHWPEQ